MLPALREGLTHKEVNGQSDSRLKLRTEIIIER